MATKPDLDDIVTACANCKHDITQFQLEEEALRCDNCGVTVCEDCWHSREWGENFEDDTYLCGTCIEAGVKPREPPPAKPKKSRANKK